MAQVLKEEVRNTILENARKNGYVRARIDGETLELDEDIKLEKTKK